MPWRSAQAPNSASAPGAPPLNRMPSSRFMCASPASCDHSIRSMPPSARRYRAGESIEDFCRACKTDRMHTVVAADADGRPIRVDCGYCHSEHNYRGGASRRLRARRPRRRARRRRRGAEPAHVSRRASRESDRARTVSHRQRTRKDRAADDRRWNRRSRAAAAPHHPRGNRHHAGRAGREMARRHARAAAGHAGAAGKELADRNVLSQGRDAAQPAPHARAAGERAPTCRTM